MSQLIRVSLTLAALVGSWLPTAGAQEAEVNVYSYRQPFLVEPLFDAFSRETGIKVNVVFAKEGLVERLSREGRNSPADLLLTTDIGILIDAADADLSEPLGSETLERNIPAQYRDGDGRWFGLTVRARIIVASKDANVAGTVIRYEDLADPALAGRLCTRSGKHVYNVALVASMIAHHGEADAEQWLRAVKANLAQRPQGNDRAQVKAISEGVCDLALINSYYMGAMLADPEQSAWARNVSIIFPNQGDRGTHVNISGAMLSRSAPNRENAIRLLEFLSDNEAQTIYAEANYEYPVNPVAPWSELLSSWGTFEADDLPLSRIGELRGEAIRMVDRVGYDE
jgi:iron(III) transport system substrate-binding protein